MNRSPSATRSIKRLDLHNRSRSFEAFNRRYGGTEDDDEDQVNAKGRIISRNNSIVSAINFPLESGLSTGKSRHLFDTLRRTGSAVGLNVAPGTQRYDSDVRNDEGDDRDQHRDLRDENSEDGESIGTVGRDRLGSVFSDERYGFGELLGASYGWNSLGPSTSKGPQTGVETNGVRVWYESYDSIDWLHDQVGPVCLMMHTMLQR